MSRFTIKNNKIYTKGKIMDKPSILIDKKAGILLKTGNKKWLKVFMEKIHDKCIKCGINSFTEDIVLIDMEEKNKGLSSIEICTIMNYLSDTAGIPDRIKWYTECNDIKEIELWAQSLITKNKDNEKE